MPNQSDPSEDPGFITQRIRELEWLREASRPEGGGATATNKDKKATEAIRIAADLFNMLAGWAVDHKIGAAAAPETGLTLDDHEHEQRGARGIDKSWTIHETQRGALVLIDVIRQAYPGRLSEIMEAQMQGIVAGAASDLFVPEKPRRGNSPSLLWSYRLMAVIHRHYLTAKGLSVTDARRKVAAAYGEASDKNIARWEERLPEVLGPSLLAHAMEQVDRDIRLEATFTTETIEQGSPAAQLVRQIIEKYSEHTLVDNGNTYRQILARQAQG